MSGIPSARIDGGDCIICTARDVLLRRMMLIAGEALREETRNQLLVALVVGWRQDPVTLCGTCHDKMQRVMGAADLAQKRMRGMQ